MWVKTSAEQTLSWIEQKKQPTVWSNVEAGILSWENWEGNMAADEQAKEGVKKERATTTNDERVCTKETHDPERADGCCAHT